MNDINDSDLKTTIQLLELLRNVQIIKGFNGTDYRLAKVLSVTPQTIAKYLQQGVVMSDMVAMTLALELDLPMSYVLLCVWKERTKSEAAKNAATEIAAKYLKVSVFILFSSVLINTLSLLQNLA